MSSHSVKKCFPFAARAVCGKAHTHLFCVVLFARKLGECVLVEIIKARRFNVLAEASAHRAAHHKDLAYAVGVDRLVVSRSVLYGDYAFGHDVKSRFLFYFLHRVVAHRDVHVAPASRQRPFPVVFADEKYLSVPEYSGAGIELRRLISCFVAEEPAHRLCRDVRHGGYHLSRYFAYALVSFPVVGVSAVCESRLCKTLQLHCPLQPFAIVAHPDVFSFRILVFR
ncbi:unknown [Anaerotruncus sp. CAG:390]|nr:unknown [Anaerotruncus sp. CAG:390]